MYIEEKRRCACFDESIGQSRHSFLSILYGEMKGHVIHLSVAR